MQDHSDDLDEKRRPKKTASKKTADERPWESRERWEQWEAEGHALVARLRTELYFIAEVRAEF